VLVAKRKNLVKQGRGNKPNACRELAKEEEEKLFESGEFGRHHPEALQLTLWSFFSLHFGFRAKDESRKLCWGDLELQDNPETGKEVLVWIAERGSETRKIWKYSPATVQFKNTRNREGKIPFELEGHRPEKVKAPSYPFFLATNRKGWHEKPNGWSV